ncbi:MAG: leucine-rich repeat domain-containing protein, partial [Kiritimatiellae bacterium]|nr:leucine-rich repeat domain-containing protein [Kiritimatiellia bacterium]
MIGSIGDGCPESFTIPNTVTWISTCAFSDEDEERVRNLTSVVIPESVCGIDEYAFDHCVNLSSVTFNKGMYVIKDFAFSGCSALGTSGNTLELPWMLKEATGDSFGYIGGTVNVRAPYGVEDQLYSGTYNNTTLNVSYFHVAINNLVNVRLHPQGGEFGRGLSLAGKISDDGSTIVEVWANKTDWNNAISRKPTWQGYVFDGFWTEKDGGKQIWDADMKYVSGTGYWSTDGKWTSDVLFNMKAYAHWKPAATPNTYTVQFHKYDGSGATAEETFKVGETKSLLWMDSQLHWMRDGYEFVGWVPWNPDSKPRVCRYVNGQKVKDLAKEGETVHLWCGWKSSSSYRVCFNKNDGSGTKLNQVILRNKEDTLA